MHVYVPMSMYVYMRESLVTEMMDKPKSVDNIMLGESPIYTGVNTFILDSVCCIDDYW